MIVAIIIWTPIYEVSDWMGARKAIVGPTTLEERALSYLNRGNWRWTPPIAKFTAFWVMPALAVVD